MRPERGLNIPPGYGKRDHGIGTRPGKLGESADQAGADRLSRDRTSGEVGIALVARMGIC
jgi:hypothetical protein